MKQLTDKEVDLAVQALNHYWNYLHDKLENHVLGDIERDQYEKIKEAASTLMFRLTY